MHWVHNFSVSLLLFPSMFYGLVVWIMMIACYEMWLVLREVTIIVRRKGPIMREKFDVMTFAQC